MILAGITAAPYLERFNTERTQIFKHVAKRHIAEKIGKYAECHISVPLLVVFVKIDRLTGGCGLVDAVEYH